jgi:hypothetical protein
VNSLAVYNDGTGPALYAAGDVVSAGGAPTEYIARWNGSTWRTWHNGPSSRYLTSSTFDPVRQNIIVAGGSLNGGGGPGTNETWTYNGASWTRAANLPGALSDYTSAFDTVRSRMVIVGRGGNMFAFDGTGWSAPVVTGFPSDRMDFQVAYDSSRDRLVMFGGLFSPTNTVYNDTWESNGSTWTQRTDLAGTPPIRSLHAMCYDPVRQRVVLFGGQWSGGYRSDTWEYDGSTWTQVGTTGPSARMRPNMTFDSLRNRVVLYGGSTGNELRDTWAWDGAVWTQLDAGSPSWPSRAANPIVYDPINDKVVQRDIGGRTWLFNGTSWTQQLGGGLNRNVSTLEVHDDGTGPALYAFGQFDQAAGQPAPNVARLNSAGWSPVGTGLGTTATSAKSFNGSLYVNAGAVRRWNGATWTPVGTLSGTLGVGDDGTGTGPALFVSGMSKLVGGSWLNLASPTNPGARAFPAATYDPVRARTVLFGGSSDPACTQPLGTTWVFNGRDWAQAATTGPSARWGAAMAWDSASNRTLLVAGGSALASTLGDTWAWDGTAWTQLSASHPGGSRLQHAIAFDSTRNRLVLFGGRSSSGIYGDTWEWDGAAWNLLSTTGPSPRYCHSMAYDSQRGKTVLVGGYSMEGSELRQQRGTWEWNGATWTLADPGQNGSPGAIAESHAVYNSVRREVVLVGGKRGDYDVSDIYAWNGSQWTQVSSNSSLCRGMAVAYDPTLQRTVVHGGIRYFMEASLSTLVLDNNWSTSTLGFGLGTFTCMTNYSGSAGPSLHMGGSIGLNSARIAQYPVTCTPPVISVQPVNVTAQFGSYVTFSVTANGVNPLAYTWRRNGVPLFDLSGFRNGTRTAQMTISAWSLNDVGTYDCVVSNPAGTTISNTATLVVNGTTVSGPVEVTRIVLPPDPAPASNGATFSNVYDPFIASTGEVVFMGEVPGQGRMISLWQDDLLSQVARVGDQPPGVATDQRLTEFNYWGVLPGGKSWYTADLFGPGISITNRRGMWFHDGAATSLIARAGAQAPGFPAGQVFTKYNDKFIGSADANGNLRFASWIDANGDRVGYGAFAWTQGSTPTVVARSGDPAPGTSTTFWVISQMTKGNSTGDTVFGAWLTGGGAGLWRNHSGTINPVAKTGDQVPGEAPGTLWNGVDENNFFLTEADAVVYQGSYTVAGATRWGIAIQDENGHRMLVKSGQPVPPTAAYPTIPAGATFHVLELWSTNELGEVLFKGNIANSCGGCAGQGLFMRGNDALHTVMIERSSPPAGTPSIFNRADPYGPGAINSSGHLIFQASLSGPGIAEYFGIYGWTRTHGTFPIVIPGTQMEVHPGVYSTVSNGRLTRRYDFPTNATPNLLETGRMVMTVGGSQGTGIFTGQFGSFLNGRFPCVGLAAPVAQTVNEGGIATLEAAPTGSSYSYQWQRNGFNLPADPRYSGRNAAVLRINAVNPNDAGDYTCSVTSTECGALTTNPATLEVLSRCGTSDYNGDGDFGTDADIEAFFACLGGTCCETCWHLGSDFNGDGDFGTDGDIESFFRVLGGGSC